MYNMDKINELHKGIRQMMGELKHEYDCLASLPDADEAYKKGLDEAWEAAKKIVLPCGDGGLAFGELKGVFGDDYSYPRDILLGFTASEALAKLRDYEARKKAEDEAVKVGDEVRDGNENGVVTQVDNEGSYILNANGFIRYYVNADLANFEKTGRHFPAIRRALRRKGMSVYELSRSTGICVATLYRAVRPKGNPSKKSIDAILAATGLTYEEAFRTEGEA